MKINLRLSLALLVSIALFCIDRITKEYAVTHYHTNPAHVTSFLSYATECNKGIAFSFFHSENPLVKWGISSLIAIILLYFIGHALSQWRTTTKIPFGSLLVVTGALSNLFDRVKYGGVIDFIVLHYHEYTWPLFNIADVLICLGLFLILINKEHR